MNEKQFENSKRHKYWRWFLKKRREPTTFENLNAAQEKVPLGFMIKSFRFFSFGQR